MPPIAPRERKPQGETSVCASPYCGKRFVPRRAWQKFCADQCRHDYHNARQAGPMAIESHAFEVMVRGFPHLSAGDMHKIVDKVKS